MKLNIEVFELTAGGHVVVAEHDEKQILYFNKESESESDAAYEALEKLLYGDQDDEELETPEPTTAIRRRIAIEPESILTLLRQAIEDRATVRILYKPITSDDLTQVRTRTIQPYRIESGSPLSGQASAYVKARDASSGDYRSFRIDNIQRAQIN